MRCLQICGRNGGSAGNKCNLGSLTLHRENYVLAFPQLIGGTNSKKLPLNLRVLQSLNIIKFADFIYGAYFLLSPSTSHIDLRGNWACD